MRNKLGHAVLAQNLTNLIINFVKLSLRMHNQTILFLYQFNSNNQFLKIQIKFNLKIHVKIQNSCVLNKICCMIITKFYCLQCTCFIFEFYKLFINCIRML